MTDRELLEARIKSYIEEHTRLTEDIYKLVSRADAVEVVVAELKSILDRETDITKAVSATARKYSDELQPQQIIPILRSDVIDGRSAPLGGDALNTKIAGVEAYLETCGKATYEEIRAACKISPKAFSQVKKYSGRMKKVGKTYQLKS